MTINILADCGQFRLDLHEPALIAAQREDRRGRGLPVTVAIAAKLDGPRREVSTLPPSIACMMETRLECDLHNVRLHSGLMVDQLSDELGAFAF